jgi:hypothetical protein
MSASLPVSPYLCQPVDRDYRDFLDEHIASLEAAPRRLAERLALSLLREERRRVTDRR